MFTSLNTGAIGIQTDLAGALALAQAHRFQGVEFDIAEVTALAERHGLDAVGRMFAGAGLRPGSFGFPVDFRGDEATWRGGLDALPRQVEVAQALGTTRAATWILPSSDEMDLATNFRWHIDRLRPAAEILADHGIRFGLEFVGTPSMRTGHRYGFLHSIDGMMALGAAIGTGNIGLLLDAYHWHTSHGNLNDLAMLTNDDIVLVHVNDALAGIPLEQLQDTVRALPCETGVIDLAGFMQALARLAYDGPVIVEPFSQRLREMPPGDAARATADSLRQLWTTAGLDG